MKTSREKLRELQKHWYKVLERSAFKDIEKMVGGEFVLKQTAAHHLWDVDQFDREMDEEYFRIIFQIANDEATIYRNEIDKIIMVMHSDGSKIKDIIKTLENYGYTRRRNSIRIIIRRYEMEWNIRTYAPKQLNIYKKSK